MKINEKLGVPDNILEIAQKTCDLLIDELGGKTKTIQDEIVFFLPIDEKIGEMFIGEIIIQINTEQVDLDALENLKVGDIKLTGMSVANLVEKRSDTGEYIYNTEEFIRINVNFIVAESELTNSSAMDFFKDNSDMVISAFAHELMHKYDHFKKPKQKAIDIIVYKNFNDIKLGIKAVGVFTHLLYFTHAIENVVRPTEVASSIRTNNVTKDEFTNFMNNDAVFTTLKQIRDFTLQGFRDDIAKEMDNVDNLLSHLKIEVNMTDDEKIDKVLETLFLGIVNGPLNAFHDFLQTNEFEKLYGLPTHKKKLMRKTITDFKKYGDNPNKFYEVITKMFKFVANKYLKKISKLYDMATIEQDSIKEWELHRKINNKEPMKLETKLLRYEDFITTDDTIIKIKK